ncbi:unnamed protein product [Alternaria alternata]
MNSTMTSSLAAGAAVPISRHFNEYDEYKLILPTSMYLVGYACGPMLWGPLSESYGRKGTMWGGTMRDRSKFCQYLRQKKMEEEKERESERAKEKERARLMANEVSAETNEIKAKEDV